MARTWTVAVTVGGVAVTSTVTGIIRVRAEENQARTAQVSFLPSAATYDPEDWIGVAVLIDYMADPDGTPVTTRVFTGSCNLPDLDETTGVLTLNCSDLLQEYFEGLADDAAILAVITGAKLADEVFGERDDGWQRTQDALSTVRKEVHKSTAGTITLCDWAAKGTADYAYTSSGYLHQSPRVTYSERRELVNSISIAYQYRYERHKQRAHSWSAGEYDTFCEWYSAGNPRLVTNQMFRDAADGAGWPLVSAISYTRLPEAGFYVCGGNPIGWLGAREDSGDAYDPTAQEDANERLVFRASWSARKRFAQTVTETYTLTVASAGSIALFGSIPGEEAASYQVEADSAGWENSLETDVPDGFSADAIGDQVKDFGDDTASDNIVTCLLQVADHRIAASHRRNYVDWIIPVEPAMDLEHTAQITAGRVTAKGKVFQLGHDLDLVNGSATTSIKIACSRGGGGTSDALTAPAAPSTAPTHDAPASATVLGYYLGGNDTVDDWVDGDHDDESYVSTNQNSITTSDSNKIYPRRVQVVGPTIEVEARDHLEASATGSYDVAVPNDTISVVIT